MCLVCTNNADDHNSLILFPFGEHVFACCHSQPAHKCSILPPLRGREDDRGLKTSYNLHVEEAAVPLRSSKPVTFTNLHVKDGATACSTSILFPSSSFCLHVGARGLG